MKTKNSFRRVLFVTVGTAFLATIFGCHEMKVETKLDADGGGTRTMDLQVEADVGDESFVTLAEYRELMGVTEARGWSHKKTTRKADNSDDMKDYHSFARSAAASGIVEMSEMSGDIFVKGSNTNPAFAGVHFSNAIEVETGVSPRGRTIVYRETFTLVGFTEALIAYRLESFRAALRQTYPNLSDADIGEWFSYFEGTAMAAVDDGIINMASGDRARRFNQSIERVVDNAMDRIRANAPDADDSLIIHIVWSVFIEWDDIDDTAEDMGLKGVVLATGLGFTLRVDIPGRIVDSNADRQEVYSDPKAGRQKMVWEIDFELAMSGPIEIYVKSEIPKS